MLEPSLKEFNSGLPRLIVVDDDHGMLDLYRIVLGEADNFRKNPLFDVDLHFRGDNAVEAVKDGIRRNMPFAVAFLDIALTEGPDGCETALQMRKLDPSIEIVFVTGRSDAGKLDNARKFHPKEKLLYIRKPFSVLELRQTAIALSAKWQAEKEFQRAQALLRKQTRQLIETNEALSILAQSIQKSRKKSEERFSLQIRSKVMPILKNISKRVAKHGAVVELDMLISYIKDITSKGNDKETSVVSALTPAEFRIACMIKNDYKNVQIADQMFISLGTVKTHRRNIRSKLDIRDSSQNLRTFLKANMDAWN
jgi:DNA-binding NarL/FixJ family response regulator